MKNEITQNILNIKQKCFSNTWNSYKDKQLTATTNNKDNASTLWEQSKTIVVIVKFRNITNVKYKSLIWKAPELDELWHSQRKNLWIKENNE